MNKAFSKIWIVVILVALFAGGILVWQYFRIPKEVIEDETADWETYRNEPYGLELKYPKDWMAREETFGEMRLAVEFAKPTDIAKSLENWGLLIYMSPNPSGETLKEFVDKELASLTASISEQESITMGKGIPGIVIKSKNGDRYVLFRNNHDKFKIIARAGYVSYIDSILSTLNFTEQRGFIISSPSYGETWTTGKTYQIQWSPSDSTKEVYIILTDRRIPTTASNDWTIAGDSLSVVWHIGGTPNTGSYSLKVPAELCQGEEYQISIYERDSSGQVIDFGSGGLFFIISENEIFEMPTWENKGRIALDTGLTIAPSGYQGIRNEEELDTVEYKKGTRISVDGFNLSKVEFWGTPEASEEDILIGTATKQTGGKGERWYFVFLSDKKLSKLEAIGFDLKGAEAGRIIFPSDIAFITKEEAGMIANWKAYQNKNYGYEVKYPPNYTTKESDQGKSLTIGTPVMPYYSISVTENVSSLEELRVLWQDSFDELLGRFPKHPEVEVTWRETVVSGKKAIEMSYEQFIGGYTGITHSTGVIKDSTAYGIGLINGSEDEYYKILSTFTFEIPFPPGQCLDGTLYGKCSSINKSRYCQECVPKRKGCETGELINKCSVCGCPLGHQCQSNEVCKKINPLITIVVNPSILSGIQSSLNQYKTDLEGEGYRVEVHSAIEETPENLRNYLQKQLSNNLIGAVLIGDLPFAQFEKGKEGFPAHQIFPIDWFYMDLDGDWLDIDNNGIYDDHKNGDGDLLSEIWIGRLTPEGFGEPVELLNNYFRKNHAYRVGRLTLPSKALLYNGLYDEKESRLDLIYDNVDISPYEKSSVEDYKTKLSKGYQWVDLNCHSGPTSHLFVRTDEFINSKTINSINPKVFFYTLETCNACRYTANEYLGGAYIFTHSYGLAVFGDTAPGGFIYTPAFYSALSKSENLGEGYKEYFTYLLLNYSGAEETYNLDLITLLGDPTLTLSP